MTRKMVFVLALLAATILVPAALAAVPTWEFNYWGAHTGTSGDPATQWVKGVEIFYQGQEINSTGYAPGIGGDGETFFEITLKNAAEPRLTKTITAWWWFALPTSLSEQENWEFMTQVTIIPDNGGTVIASPANYEKITDLNDLPAEVGVNQTLRDWFSADGTGALNVPFIVKGTWKIIPQPGEETLRWQRPANYTGDVNLNPCNVSRFYVNTQCAPGLPALVLIGIPPLFGALIRRRRR